MDSLICVQTYGKSVGRFLSFSTLASQRESKLATVLQFLMNVWLKYTNWIFDRVPTSETSETLRCDNDKRIMCFRVAVNVGVTHCSAYQQAYVIARRFIELGAAKRYNVRQACTG